MDLDTTRTRTAYERIISDFQQGKTDILIGTQMVSKGLDFDHVSIVGILNADTMLNYPDFRAYERAFQLMAQVADAPDGRTSAAGWCYKPKASTIPSSRKSLPTTTKHGRRAACRTPDVPLPALLPPGVCLPEEPERDPARPHGTDYGRQAPHRLWQPVCWDRTSRP